MSIVNLKIKDQTVDELQIGNQLRYFICSSTIMCELIDLLLSLKMREEGLKVLSISGFNKEIKHLEPALMNRLAAKCHNLEQLCITRTFETPSIQNIVHLVQEIAVACPPLLHLDLTRFSEVPSHGKDILGALLDAGIITLRKAIFSCLYFWWRDSECFQMAMTFIGQ